LIDTKPPLLMANMAKHPERGKPIKFKRYDSFPKMETKKPKEVQMSEKYKIKPIEWTKIDKTGSGQAREEEESGLTGLSFKTQMQNFYKAIEVELEKFVGDLSTEDVKNRCKRVSCVGSLNVERWYLDDQLLFETEKKYAGNVLKWEIRKPE